MMVTISTKGCSASFQYKLFDAMGIDTFNPTKFQGLKSVKDDPSWGTEPSVHFSADTKSVALFPGENKQFGRIMHALQHYDDITFTVLVKLTNFDVSKGNQKVSLVSFSTPTNGVGEELVFEISLHFEYSNFIGELTGESASSMDEFSQMMTITKKNPFGGAFENRVRVGPDQKLKLNKWTSIMVQFKKNIGAQVSIGCSPLPSLQLQGVPFHGNPCGIQYDIQFIIDSSGSLKEYWHKEKEFVKKLARALGVGYGNRVGVISFSYHAEQNIKMSESLDLADFNQRVDDIKLQGYTTRMDKALSLADEVMFNVNQGARKHFQKLLIFLTDGKQSQRDGKTVGNPGTIAAAMRQKKVKIFTIGIGDYVDYNELQSIAGVQSQVYQAKSFNDLFVRNFAEKVTSKVCTKSTLPLRGVMRLGQKADHIGLHEVLVDKLVGNMYQPQFLIGEEAFNLLNPCDGTLKEQGLPANPSKNDYGPKTWQMIQNMIGMTSNNEPSFVGCSVEAFGVRTEIHSGDSVIADECNSRGCFRGCRKHNCYNGKVTSEYVCSLKCRRRGQVKLSNEEWYEKKRGKCQKYKCVGRRSRPIRTRRKCTEINPKIGCYCLHGYLMNKFGKCEPPEVEGDYVSLANGFCRPADFSTSQFKFN